MKRFLAISLLLYVALPIAAQESANYKKLSTPRFILYIEQNELTTDNQGIAETRLSSLALNLLEQTHREISRILKVTPKEKVILRFLSPEEFRKQTAAPSWTNAMFFRGEITMPFNKSQPLDIAELREALRHEYTHALLAEASGYRIPAWLDEGIAQVIEGKQNPVLAPSLRQLAQTNQAIALKELQNGFTSLDSKIVPAAYAQSLFAAKSIINRYGFKEIANYLKQLKDGKSDETAFLNAFGQSQNAFENQLAQQIKRWSESSKAEI